MAVNYVNFDIKLMDLFTGLAVNAIAGTFTTSAGVCQVCIAGSPQKQTVYDPNNNYAALANPVPLLNGRIQFAIQEASPGGQPGQPVVDIYGISPTGHFYVKKSITPGLSELWLNVNEREDVAIIPFCNADSTPNVEKDTTFVLPDYSLVGPPPIIFVSTLQSAQTIKFGLLSSQTNGNATGFVNGASVAAAGLVKSSLASGGTIGALLFVTTAGGATVPEPFPIIPGNARNVSYTTSAGTTGLTGGFLSIPYQLTQPMF